MNRILIIIGLLGVFLFSSCLMQKVEYVKNMSPDSLYNIKASETLKIQRDDRLLITVFSEDKELSAPFNTELGGYSLATENEVLKGVNATSTFEEGYLVDSNGDIEFPILGKIKVVGLSTDEISLLIAGIIKNNKYIKDPEVKVKLLNFKIMTMGVIRNEIISVENGKITLLEAIVKAGGLTANADATKVMVIRENGEERKLLINNMEDYDMFNSESYNLKQNDIVYVAPRYKQVSPGTQSVYQVVGMFFGAISLTLTSLLLIKNNGK